MGADEKHAAAYHGGEYTPLTERVREDYATRMAPYADSTRRIQFDRWLETVRAEAKAEELESLAQELADLDRAGADEPVSAYDAAVWIRARANQYKEQS